MAGNSTAGRSMSTKPVPKKTVAAVAADSAAKAAAAAAGEATTAGKHPRIRGGVQAAPLWRDAGNRLRQTKRTDHLPHKAGRTTCRLRLRPPLAGRALIGFQQS